ncbi:uncharacterized protein LY89DRAFT_787732 [Mollisia scopiformis]|uniref:C2H2-type domain-containing protein n=1 Tax=Mollisia scopiformis TaxID=149040 RepID=A0A132BEI0_MOLSC|nr:uncharacterized protein LY89DRAFT_787732 [Mollisia scopiformis]KUJ10087.1 hypothetical protein LY89DRAFT_787732 [Mollisia scopiformis]
MFEAALKLKAATVPTEHNYEFIVYPPGTSRVLPAVGLASGSWIHASMHAYTRGLTGPRGRMADALIQSMNFVDRDIEDRERVGVSLHSRYISTPIDQDTNPSDARKARNASEIEQDDETDVEAARQVLDSEYEDDDLRPKKARKRGLKAPPTTSSTAKIRPAKEQPAKRIGSDEDIYTSRKRQRKQGISCEICGATFSASEALTRHKETRVCSVCALCNKICKSKKEQVNHHATEHNKKLGTELQGQQQSTDVADDRKPSQGRLTDPNVQPDAQPSHQSHPGPKTQSESQTQTKENKQSVSKLIATGFICDICHRVDFQDMKGLKSHRLRVHKEPTRTEVSETPPTEDEATPQARTTRRRSSVREMVNESPPNSSDKRPAPQKPASVCPDCGKDCLQPKLLKIHIKNQDCLRCVDCGIWFEDDCKFDQHWQTTHRQAKELLSPSPPSDEPSGSHVSQRTHVASSSPPSKIRSNTSESDSGDRRDEISASQDLRSPRSLEPSEEASEVSSEETSEDNETQHDPASRENTSTPLKLTSNESFSSAIVPLSRRSTRGQHSSSRMSERSDSRHSTPMRSDGNQLSGMNHVCQGDNCVVRASDIRADNGPCSKREKETTVHLRQKGGQGGGSHITDVRFTPELRSSNCPDVLDIEIEEDWCSGTSQVTETSAYETQSGIAGSQPRRMLAGPQGLVDYMSGFWRPPPL